MKSVAYLTDDRDLPHQAELHIISADNGDWYQQISWVDDDGLNRVSPPVRICTSGGAATLAPKFVIAVADQFRALDAIQTRLAKSRE